MATDPDEAPVVLFVDWLFKRSKLNDVLFVVLVLLFVAMLVFGKACTGAP